ncbi:MarR family winged helix-turn-helix transcriptional regulator [Bacterioplanoides sp.]|uniref:MarR family winged helix-turn-helix transcriptional regulator n=1 Tax=Bacterioplanoides sp. TaxID=2066072 RepID=UPI003B5C937C
MDKVDNILAQWQAERPDLDTTPMGPIGRLKRCAALMQPKLDKVFAEFELSYWEFDVLATLKRSGAPYCLAPTTLFSTLMVTSGTMTHRMNQLEKRGLIERLANPEDARSKLVRLTAEGAALADRAVEAHLQNERHIISELSPEQLQQIDDNLRTLLAVLEEH